MMNSNFDYRRWRIEKRLHVTETYTITAASEKEALETANQTAPDVIDTSLVSIDATLMFDSLTSRTVYESEDDREEGDIDDEYEDCATIKN